MRGLAVGVGGLLLIGGATLVVVADQQRQAEIDSIRAQVQQAEQRLEVSQQQNLDLAGSLTALRSKIARQDAEIADSTGFLQ